MHERSRDDGDVVGQRSEAVDRLKPTLIEVETTIDLHLNGVQAVVGSSPSFRDVASGEWPVHRDCAALTLEQLAQAPRPRGRAGSSVPVADDDIPSFGAALRLPVQPLRRDP